MGYLIDTNVISEVKSRSPEPKVIEWLASVRLSQSYLSAITVGEIQKGISGLPRETRRREELSRWIEDDVLETFSGRVLALDVAVMRAWGRLTADLQARGNTMGLMDSLIAATAVHHGLTLVTRNEADFQNTPVDVINPWKEV
ncbi:MAG: type II toxin-antitoxin system VapC family toxin [Actinomycetota bacterium]|nr:type II toxin-antitoxin system VapC family toxin [Actinomycetota bacterium]